MYYAKVSEIMPSVNGKMVFVTDVVYGFASYKWRDTYVREYNELAQREPYYSSDIVSRACVVKRDVFRWSNYVDITENVEGLEYMPLKACRVWASADLLQEGMVARTAPNVRVPAKVDYEFRGGYACPKFD